MKEKRNAVLSDRLAMIGKFCLLFLFLLMVAGCTSAASTPAQPAASPTAGAAAATAVVPPTETPLPVPTVTQPPTATPEPSVTPTQVPSPTATALPALAVAENGFNAWCAPLEYAGTKPTSSDAPQNANKMDTTGSEMQVKIPASYCVVVVRFNQSAPNGTQLTFFDGKSPFLKLPLQTVAGKADEVWTPVTHSFVVNPPLWSVDYRLSVTGPDGKELWSGLARFAKPTPEACLLGNLPDPVTLYCNPFDPREIEPHQEDPNYKYRTPVP